jgi:opacity protein-like surface antigen
VERNRGFGWFRWLRWSLWLLCSVGTLPVASVTAWAGDEASRWRDTGRLYLDVVSGQSWILDKDFAGDARLDAPDGFNVVLGGSLGYNISDHWGAELQFQGTEPDIRSSTRGKLAEFSNITVMPAARLRWPVGEGRLVPWATAGIGVSANDINDTTNESVRLKTDDMTIAGSIAAGIDYFLDQDVSVGLGLHSYLYPDQDTEYSVVNAQHQQHTTTGTMNQTSVAILGHLRVFLGEPPAPGESRPRNLFLADHGPYDTAAMRGYVAGLFGVMKLTDTSFGGGVKQNNDENVSTLGGAVGMNFNRYWGAEVQLLVVDRILDQPPYGKLGELSIFTIVPTVRFRYPFCDGRLVPFWTAGLGVGFARPNDRKPVFTSGPGPQPRQVPSIDTSGAGVVGSVGIGVEYFLNRHISAGLVLPVQFGPRIDTSVTQPGGAPTAGHLQGSSVGGMLRLTAYVP